MSTSDRRGSGPPAHDDAAPPIPPAEDGPSSRRGRLPLRRLIEVLPVLIALTALFSYTTIRGVDEGSELVTPPRELFGAVPGWVGALMLLVALVGVGGMGWLLYVYTRAPVVADGEGEQRD